MSFFLIPREASEPQVATNGWICCFLLLLLLSNIPGTNRASLLSSLSERGSVGKRRRLPRPPLISPSSASASHLPGALHVCGPLAQFCDQWIQPQAPAPAAGLTPPRWLEPVDGDGN